MQKILVVDDLDNNRLSLVLQLEKITSLEIHEASDGLEAVELCARESFDLIFMDIMMPNLDGFEATKYIKQLHPHTMIIALSALDDETAKHKMLSFGAEDYLTKPIDPIRIFARIEHYLNIIAFRKQKSIEQKKSVINPFDAHVFSKKTVYTIESNHHLGEFWDDCLNTTSEIIDLSDAVRLMYGVGLWLLKNNVSFEIVIESNTQHTYLSLIHKGTLKQTIVKNILLKHYASLHYLLDYTLLSFKLKHSVKPTLGEATTVQEHLRNPPCTSMDAKTYLEHTPISFFSKIDHLDRINDAIDSEILAFEKSPNYETIKNICEALRAYIEILEQLMEFEHLGYALRMLVDCLLKIKNDQLSQPLTKKSATILLNIVYDLSSWRENIFINQSAIDIHYLDASLLSSCLQLEAVFEPEAHAEFDNEIEFF